MDITIKDNSKIKIMRKSLGNELQAVREELSKIDFNSSGMHILKIQPGVGKTHRIKEVLKKQERFIILTGSHKLLGEEYSGLGASHWKGFAKECKEYKNIKKLYKSDVPVKTICELKKCDQNHCSYWKQFNTKKAIAPYHFLPTNRVEYKIGSKKDQFKFDVLIIDESMKEYTKIGCNKDEVIESLTVMEKYVSKIPFKTSLINELDYPDFTDFEIFLNKHFKDIIKIKQESLLKAINKKQFDDVALITRFNIFNIRKAVYYQNIHGKTIYYEPIFYNVIDLARQGIPIVLLDATFDEKALKVLLSRYEYEDSIIPRSKLIKKDLKPLETIQINIYESEITKKDLTIYRMDKDNNYYRKAFEHDFNREKTVNELKKFIKRAKRTYPKIGIVTYQDLKNEFKDLGDVEYFHNLRGSNKIQDADALFLIGTPQQPLKILDDYNKLSLTDINENDVHKLTNKKINNSYFPINPNGNIETSTPYINLKAKNKPSHEILLEYTKTGKLNIEKNYTGLEEKKPHALINKNINKFRVHKNFNQEKNGETFIDFYYPLHEFDINLSESEKHQAIHRVRPLIPGKKPKIFIFGDVPEAIKNEFTVKNMNKKETVRYFHDNFKGIYPIPLFDAITEQSRKNPKSMEIAKALKIYKKDKKGYNTPFVTNITKNTSIDEINKIDSAIKEGFNNAETIKRKYTTIKLDKEILEYFIYYAKEGHFIQI